MMDSKLIRQTINRQKVMSVRGIISTPTISTNTDQIIAQNEYLVKIIEKQKKEIDFLLHDLKNDQIIGIGEFKEVLTKDIIENMYFIHAKPSFESNNYKLKDWVQNVSIITETNSITENTKISKKSRLSTALFAGIMVSLIGITMIVVPSPYNILSSIALCGPLSVSLYGLKK